MAFDPDTAYDRDVEVEGKWVGLDRDEIMPGVLDAGDGILARMRWYRKLFHGERRCAQQQRDEQLRFKLTVALFALGLICITGLAVLYGLQK